MNTGTESIGEGVDASTTRQAKHAGVALDLGSASSVLHGQVCMCASTMQGDRRCGRARLLRPVLRKAGSLSKPSMPDLHPEMHLPYFSLVRLSCPVTVWVRRVALDQLRTVGGLFPSFIGGSFERGPGQHEIRDANGRARSPRSIHSIICGMPIEFVEF